MTARSILPALLLLAAATTAFAESRIVGLQSHGTSTRYWIVRAEQDSESDDPVIHRDIFVRGDGDETWTPVARFQKPIVDLAHRDDRLAVLFNDGRWQLVWGGGSALGRKDDAGRIERLAAGDALWAIVRTTAAGDDDTAETAKAEQPATDETKPSTLLLKRFDRDAWATVADLPAEASGVLPQLAEAGGTPYTASLGEGRRLELAGFDADDASWQTLPVLPLDENETRWRLIAHRDGPAVWSAAKDLPGRVRLFANGGWQEIALPTPTPGVTDQPTVAFAMQNLRLIYLNDGRIFEQMYRPDGTTTGEAVELSLLGRADEREAPIDAFGILILASLLVALMAVTRPRPPEEAKLDAERAVALKLAPLSRRLAAGLIDLSPLLLVIGYVATQFEPVDGADTDAIAQRFTLPVYGGLIVYILHTGIAEMSSGQSLGKWLFGLHVVDLQGQRPGKSAIFVRNLLRMIDVMILPLALVPLSPLRQRMGDLAARTVVVVKTAVTPEDRDAREKARDGDTRRAAERDP